MHVTFDPMSYDNDLYMYRVALKISPMTKKERFERNLQRIKGKPLPLNFIELTEKEHPEWRRKYANV